jgi:hypothetical protein
VTAEVATVVNVIVPSNHINSNRIGVIAVNCFLQDMTVVYVPTVDVTTIVACDCC